MSNEQQIQPLLNVLNEETRSKIIELDKRLRILLTETESMLRNVASYSGENPEGHKNDLLEMQQNLIVALNGISELVNLPVPPGHENHPVLSGELMKDFTEMLSANLERVNLNKIE